MSVIVITLVSHSLKLLLSIWHLKQDELTLWVKQGGENRWSLLVKDLNRATNIRANLAHLPIQNELGTNKKTVFYQGPVYEDDDQHKIMNDLELACDPL